MLGLPVSDQGSNGIWPISFRRRESPFRNSSNASVKRNVIPEVDDKSIIMFFKKGLKDSVLIHKLAMKNPKTLEKMLAIANKYTLEEEETPETRESKKDQKPSYSDRLGTSKSNNKNRKYDHSMANVE
jgi:hypothetical protein